MREKPADALKRRKRSRLNEEDCLEVLRRFAMRVKRFGETSDASMFRIESQNVVNGDINVQFLIQGSFGSGDEMFEAIRVLRGWKLPRKD